MDRGADDDAEMDMPAEQSGPVEVNMTITVDPRDPERRFCPRCSNMWYPRENRATLTLMLTCRNCAYEERSDNPKIYENKIVAGVTNRLAEVDSDMTQDVTLQRSAHQDCAECGATDCVLFQAEEGNTAKSLSLIFVCCDCGAKWVG